MAVITPADISLEVTPLVETPTGFLRASAVGVESGAAFDEVLLAIIAAVHDHLAAYNVSPTSPNPRHALAAKALARYYAAEQVLATARTGSVKDPEGASVTLSAGDLAHWERMRADGLARAEALLGQIPGPPRSGVYFPSVRLRREAT